MEKINRYRCIKEMEFESCDYEGFPIPNKNIVVPIGSIWQESKYMISGGDDNVHLDREDLENRHQWCEPLKEEMAEYFEEIEPLIVD